MYVGVKLVLPAILTGVNDIAYPMQLVAHAEHLANAHAGVKILLPAIQTGADDIAYPVKLFAHAEHLACMQV